MGALLTLVRGGGDVEKGGGKGTKDSGGGSSGGVYEVTILNTNLPSRRKKQISLDVNKALGPRMTSVVSPNKTKVRNTRRTTAHTRHDTTRHTVLGRGLLKSGGWGQVWAVELPVQVLRELVACAIRELQQYQQQAYNLLEVPRISALFVNLPTKSDDELYNLSLKREPRGADRSAIA